MFENLGSALLSKGILIKGAAAAVGGATIGVTWWQVYDNIYPKTVQEEMGQEEMGQDSVFSSKSHTSLDDIPDLQLTFSGSDNKYKDEFTENDCIKKYLPGKISDVAHKEIYESGSDTSKMSANGFDGHTSRKWQGFVGTEGCLSINIKYKNDSNNGGIIGKIELVAWNNPNQEDDGYAMIMSSIISNLKGEFNFVNKLTFLKKPRQHQDWQFDSYNGASAIWLDSASTNDSNDKEIKFTFGKEVFTYKTTKNNSSVNQLNENTDNVEYKKLARWIPGEKEKGNNDALLGHWNISIGNKKTDLWKSLGEIKEAKKQMITSKLFYKESGKKWYKGRKFEWDFDNFDRWNPGHNDQNNGNNHLSIYGTWVDVWKECIKNKNENVCLNRN